MFVRNNTAAALNPTTETVLLAATINFSGVGAQQFVITAFASCVFKLNSAATVAKIVEPNDPAKIHETRDGNNPAAPLALTVYQKANAWMAIRLQGVAAPSNAASADSLGPDMLQTLAVSASFTVNPGQYTIELVGRGSGSPVQAMDRSMIISMN